MNYYDNQVENEKKGIDYDLIACLEYNPQPFTVEEIDKVLAVFEGEHDGDDWRWVIKLNKEGKKSHGVGFVFLQGGCDYTGWDCQSWAKSEFAKTALLACKVAYTAPEGSTYNEAVTGMGLGRMLNAMSGEYMHNTNLVYDTLVEQIRKGKDKTWRESKEDEFKNELPKV